MHFFFFAGRVLPAPCNIVGILQATLTSQTDTIVFHSTDKSCIGGMKNVLITVMKKQNIRDLKTQDVFIIHKWQASGFMLDTILLDCCLSTISNKA